MSGNTVLKARITASTVAQVGLARDEKHNYFLDGKGPITSVTTILKIVDKSGPLVGWAKRITAEAAVRHAAELPKWVADFGEDGAVSMLTKASNVIRDKAANTGSDVHAIASAITQGHDPEMTDEQRPYVESYLAFRRDFQPRTLATEEMVCNLTYGYAGTFDEIDEIADENWMIDLKSSRGIYAETSMQIASYGRGEFIGRAGDPERYALPRIDQYGVLHLTPNGYELVPYDVNEGTFQAFLAAKQLWDWSQGPAKTVMGQPVGPALLKFPHAPAKEAVA